MWPNITNMLSWWQWGLISAVPAGIVLLYFLKLKRQPLEVPSTYLWHKSIEDLHVNSIWQRLRRSLLLFLQLLLILLVILALLRPSWSGTKIVDSRSIFVIDNSASMSAKDVVTAEGETISRLDEAKRQVLELIDQMESTDVGMLISVSNLSNTAQPYTDDRSALRRAVKRIKPTHKTTDFNKVLRIAAGIANPGRTGTEPSKDMMGAEALPATLYLFTDGNFEHPSFSFGNLEPKYIRIGSDQPKNVAIHSFSAERSENQPNELAVFALLENYGPEDVEVRADLYLDGKDQGVNLIVEIPAAVYPEKKKDGEASNTKDGDDENEKNEEVVPGSNGLNLTLPNIESGVLKLHISGNDVLEIDDDAWFTVNAPRRAKVLLITPGNKYLHYAFNTQRAKKLAVVVVEAPEYLKTDEYLSAAHSGFYDVIIYDRCLPAAKKDDDKTPTPMPECNTWFIGAAPKSPAWGWEAGKPWPPEPYLQPKVLDVASGHPLMELVELDNVRIIAWTIPLKKPPGGAKLIDTLAWRRVKSDPEEKTKPANGEKAPPRYESVATPMLVIAPRQGHEDLVLGAPIVGELGDEKNVLLTDWPTRTSFPVFIYNILRYLGGSQNISELGTIRAGDPLDLKIDTAAKKLYVVTPNDVAREISRSKQNTFLFSGADRLGAYQIRDAEGETVGRFAVNLFDSRESNLMPAREIDFDWLKVEGKTNFQTERKEYWKWLLLLALLVLLFEWYIYNRRVYL